MRICYFGNITSVTQRRVAEYFAGRGNEVHFITFDFTEIRSDIRIHQLKGHSISFFSKLWRVVTSFTNIKNTLSQINPDVLHCFGVSSYGLIGVLINFHPLVLGAMGSDVLIRSKRTIFHRLLISWILRKAQLVTSSARNMTETLIGFGIPLNRILTFHYGIDLQKFNLNERDFLRRESGIPVRLICTRYFEAPQNVKYFIRALPRVFAEKSKEIEILILGTGSQKKEILALVDKLSLNGKIQFCGEIVHDKMPDYYRNADIYVSPSYSDTNHISLTEAMACGCFPVITDIPANRYWVTHGVNGLLASPNDQGDFACKIIQAIEDRPLRVRAMKINSQIVNERASWGSNIASLELGYNTLLSIY